MKFIGDGGHAKVIRALMAEFSDLDFDEEVTGTFIAVGNNVHRSNEVELRRTDTFPILQHPFSWVAPDVVIGEGTVIMAGAVVQPGVTIGKHCIINTCASLDHDSIIGDFVHIAPGARLCGNVTVGEGTLVGAGAVCLPGAVIPPWTTVKAGSVVK